MKPKDIVAGRIYKHSDFPDVKYLGITFSKNVGTKSLPTYEEHTKGLVTLNSGRVVVRQHNSAAKFWSKFSPFIEKYNG